MELKSFGVKLKVECGLGGVREQGRFCISGIVGDKTSAGLRQGHDKDLLILGRYTLSCISSPKGLGDRSANDLEFSD